MTGLNNEVLREIMWWHPIKLKLIKRRTVSPSPRPSITALMILQILYWHSCNMLHNTTEQNKESEARKIMFTFSAKQKSVRSGNHATYVRNFNTYKLPQHYQGLFTQYNDISNFETHVNKYQISLCNASVNTRIRQIAYTRHSLSIH